MQSYVIWILTTLLFTLKDFYKDIADYIRKDTIHQIMNRINEI